MSESEEAVESVAEAVDRAFSGGVSGKPEKSAPATAESLVGGARYDFDTDYQEKIAALIVRDPNFARRTEGLIQPDFFEEMGHAKLVDMAQQYYEKYRSTPDKSTMMRLIKKAVEEKRLRKDDIDTIKESFKAIYRADVSDRDFVIEDVSEFAQHQAMSNAVLESVDLVEKGSFEKVMEMFKTAMNVGSNDTMDGYDYWDSIEARTHTRKDVETSGRRNGITTGVRKLDKCLYHSGWGLAELSVLMGGPKVGKSTALGGFAKNASLAGYNVLVVSLEVSAEIIAERLDATVADIAVDELGSRIMEAEEKVKLAGDRAGKLILHEYPTGQMNSSQLRRLLNRYRADGVIFDMVVLDYADLMAPMRYSGESTIDSKSIYTDLRAIAQEENLAMLTATQTNREGAKSAVSRMEHVAEDFNRVRIADILISINVTEDEKARNEARLFFAASRNQKGEFSIRIKQDLERMHFIQKILGFE